MPAFSVGETASRFSDKHLGASSLCASAGNRCSSVRWSSTNMRFTCQPGCTNCCRVKGFVYLTEGDLRRAAAFLGLSHRAFEAKYVYRTRHLLRLRKPRNAQCCFLKEEGCLLHPSKPTQCRLFPFWPELVGARAAWRDVAGICPGIGRGQLKSVETVRRLTLKMRQAYSSMYPDAGA